MTNRVGMFLVYKESEVEDERSITSTPIRPTPFRVSCWEQYYYLLDPETVLRLLARDWVENGRNDEHGLFFVFHHNLRAGRDGEGASR